MGLPKEIKPDNLSIMKPAVPGLLLFIAFHLSMAQFTTSNLPIILIDTDQGVEITKERITAHMRVADHSEQRNSVSGPYNNYDGIIAIKGRGSSSWEMYEKKGYTLETQLDSGKNNNVELLGLPAENDWVLHGPYADKTLMKNALVYTLGAEIGRYAPRHRFCELVLNGEYRGVYLLVERIKRDKNRVDISALDPTENTGDDLTGGYIMRIDRDEEDGYSWMADFGFGLTYFNYYYPDPEDMSQTQRDYIRNYFFDFENALAGQPFSDTENGYRAYADVGSFIDYFIISELTKNLDAYRLSTYFYKDKDSKGGKLTMGPIWDFNLSCGGVNIGFGDWAALPENWVSDDLPGGTPFWWSRLLEDQYYNSCLKQRWSHLRAEIINEEHINALIDGFAELLDEAKDRNFEIFPLAEPVWGNNHFGLTYEQELGMLKSFLKDRIEWMDLAIVYLPGDMACRECYTNCDQSILGANARWKTLNIYPNPVKDRLTIGMDLSQAGVVEIDIHDLSGRKVLSVTRQSVQGYHDYVIDLSSISPSGILTYQLKVANQLISSGTFIRE